MLISVPFAGGGYGIVGMASWLIVREYFGPKPNIANTLYACAFPAGIFTFSLITRVLYDNFSYFGTFLISSAIMMNCVVCALLFRPVAQVTMKGVLRETSVYKQMNSNVDNMRYTPNNSPTINKTPSEPFKEPVTEVAVENDKESLNPKDAKTYHSVEGPSDSMVVSTLEKSWKFDDTVLYESDDDEDTTVDKEKPDTPEDVQAAPINGDIEGTPTDEPDGITTETSQEVLEPVSKTLLEVIVGVSDVRQLCNWRLLLFLLSGMVYSLGYGVPFCMYPDVARFRGETLFLELLSFI